MLNGDSIEPQPPRLPLTADQQHVLDGLKAEESYREYAIWYEGALTVWHMRPEILDRISLCACGMIEVWEKILPTTESFSHDSNNNRLKQIWEATRRPDVSDQDARGQLDAAIDNWQTAVEKHRSTRREQFRAFARKVAHESQLDPLSDEFGDIEKHLQLFKHHRKGNPPDGNAFEILLARSDRFLAKILLPTLTQNAKRIRSLLTRAQESPVVPEEVADELVEIVRFDVAAYSYFFRELYDPHWLGPLRVRKFLTYPPSTRPPSFHWPDSECLPRMAAKAPEDVIATIRTWQCPTGTHGWVLADVLRVALNVPTQWIRQATELLSKLLEKSNGAEPFFWHDDFCSLIRRLMSTGNRPLALKLVYKCIYVDRQAAENGVLRSEIGANAWQVGEILGKCLPDILSEEPEAVVKAVFKALCGSCQVRLKGLWIADRPAIEPHDRNDRRQDQVNVLIDAMRDALVLSAKNESNDWVATHLHSMLFPNNSDDVSSVLCRRIALYVLGESGLRFQQLLFSVLTHYTGPIIRMEQGPQLKCRYEFCRMLGNIAPRLSESEREHIQTKVLEVSTESDVADVHEKQRRDGGLWAVLHSMRDSLSGVSLHKYELLRPQFEYSNDDEVRGYIRRTPKRDQPLSAGMFSSSTVSQIAEFSSEWVPSGAFLEPDFDTLAQIIRMECRERPLEFSQNANCFAKCPPPIVATVLSELRELARNGVVLNWTGALPFVRSVLSRFPCQDLDELNPSHPSVTWLRRSCLDLIDAGLIAELAGDEAMDLLTGHAVPMILELLADSLSPAPEDEGYGPGRMGPHELAINCTRGRAVESCVTVLRWISELEESAMGALSKNVGDCKDRVLDGLSTRLDVTLERSLAVRSAMAQSWGRLSLSVKEWTHQCEESLFPKDAELAVFRQTAWEGFIQWHPAHSYWWERLQVEYVSAVGRLADCAGSNPTDRRCDLNLGRHLLVYHARGMVGIDDGGLLGVYLRNIGSDTLGEMIAAIGAELSDPSVLGYPHVVTSHLRVVEWCVIGRKELADGKADWLAQLGRFASAKCVERQKIYRMLELCISERVLPTHEGEVLTFLATCPVTDLTKCIGLLGRLISLDVEVHKDFHRMRGAVLLDSAAVSNLISAGMKASAPLSDLRRLTDGLIRIGFPHYGEMLDGYE